MDRCLEIRGQHEPFFTRRYQAKTINIDTYVDNIALLNTGLRISRNIFPKIMFDKKFNKK